MKLHRNKKIDMVTCSQSNFKSSAMVAFSWPEERAVHHLSLSFFGNIGKVPKEPTCDPERSLSIWPKVNTFCNVFLFMTISLHSHHTALMTMFSKLKIPCLVMGYQKQGWGSNHINCSFIVQNAKIFQLYLEMLILLEDKIE